jgi:hypothetical protein
MPTDPVHRLHVHLVPMLLLPTLCVALIAPWHGVLLPFQRHVALLQATNGVARKLAPVLMLFLRHKLLLRASA